MFKIIWDKVNNGLILTSNGDGEALNISPRPVFYEELDLLGFKDHWEYPASNEPLLWAQERRYYYKGNLVAEVRGGNLYDEPKIEITKQGKGLKLEPINIKKLIETNRKPLFLIEQEALEFIEQTFNTYSKKRIKSRSRKDDSIDWNLLAELQEKRTKIRHAVVKQDCDSFDIMPLEEANKQNKTVYLNTKIDLFISSFSGGKDSQVTLDLVSRVIPPDKFEVIFSDTGMEIPPSMEIFELTKSLYNNQYPELKFFLARNHQSIQSNWEKFGPPSRLQRWCCTVAKTAPLYRLLKDVHGNGKQPNVLVFEGVRAEESNTREKYARIGKGVKHNMVINARPIFHWNASEIYLYLFMRNLPMNEGYRKGLARVGCSICPFSSEWSEFLVKKLYPEKINKFIDLIYNQTESIGIDAPEKKISYLKEGNWKKRAGGKLNESNASRIDFIQKTPFYKVIITNPKENILEWLKVIGTLHFISDSDEIKGEIYVDKINVPFQISNNRIGERLKQIVIFKNISENALLISKIRKVLYKTTYCNHCEACEVECPTGALSVEPRVKIDSKKCIQCGKCTDITTKGCLLASAINTSEGNQKNTKGMRSSGIDKYSTFGLRERWLTQYFNNIDDYFVSGNNDLGTKMVPAFSNWLRDAELLNRTDKNPSEIGNILKDLYFKNPELVWELIWVNLSYNSLITQWFIKNAKFDIPYSKNELLAMLQNDFPDYGTGTLKNPLSALANTFDESPIGNNLNIGQIRKKGNAIESITRKSYENLDSISVAYSLYRFSQHKNRTNFTVGELYSDEQSNGVYIEFGLSKERFLKVLRALQENRHSIINVDLVMGLDNISVREDLNYVDILKVLLESPN